VLAQVLFLFLKPQCCALVALKASRVNAVVPVPVPVGIAGSSWPMIRVAQSIV